MDQFLHEFRSITEEQWKSGRSRFKCAICSQDYGDPIHCVATTPSLESNFRIKAVSSDRYEPDTAVHLLRGLRELDDESARVMVKLWAQDAMVEEGEHRN